jgi:hypothetical protein
MRASLTKTVAISLTALTLGVATIGATIPAIAAGPTWHGGHGGWHGGWRGGGWGWGPFAVGALAGAALAAPYYGYYGYGGYNGCLTYQPTYDRYGNYVGQQPTYIC